MHIKFLSHGTGDPHKAVAYLLANFDYKGAQRPKVLVLRGDPRQVAMVVDSLPQLHRYTSGVIAWAHEDAPTTQEVDDVLDDFERVAFAGLSRDRFSYTAISHGDHVHLFIAKVDLLTCKSFNVAPPGWKKDFYPWRDYWNGSKGWARPDDPNRARLLAMPLPRYSPAMAKKMEEDLAMGYELVDVQAALDVEPESEFFIAQWLVDLIHGGKILAHKDVLNELSKEGAVTQVSRTTLNFLPHGSDQAIKLCGRLFATDFNAQEVFDRTAIREAQWSGRSKPDPAFAQAALQKMQTAIALRTAYNQRVYKPKIKRVERLKPSGQVRSGRRTAVNAVPASTQSMAARPTNSIAGHAWRALAAARDAIEQCKLLLKTSMQLAAQAISTMSCDDNLKIKRALGAKSVIPNPSHSSTRLASPAPPQPRA